MKTALFSILAKHAYAQESSGHLASAGSLAAHPVTAHMAVTADAGDVSPSFDSMTHDLSGSINSATASYVLSGEFAKNYIDDIELLMGTYSGHISATVNVQIVNGETVVSETTEQAFTCASGSLQAGSCVVNSADLFTQTTDFLYECHGDHDVTVPAGDHNKIVLSDLSSDASFKAGTTGSTIQVSSTWTDESNDYNDACAFELTYGFTTRVIVKVFESADATLAGRVQIGAALQRTVPIDVVHTFAGYEMKPAYAGVAAAVAEIPISAITVEGSQADESMAATVNNTVSIATVDITCDSTLSKLGDTTVLDAIWVYQLIVNGCRRAGEDASALADDLLLIAPKTTSNLHGSDALVTQACLDQVITPQSPTAAAVLAAAACELEFRTGGVGDECSGREQDDQACIQWEAGGSYVSSIGGDVHSTPAAGELKVALAKYVADGDAEGLGNSFGMWFYVRLADTLNEDYAGEENTMSMTLPLEATKQFAANGN